MAKGGGESVRLGAAAMTLVEERPPLDLIIIGGGVNGAGIARAAAGAGLRVALFERDDFGSGTTWRSTKLVHGGLRYLEHGDIRLVRESLRERERLLRERPWLVKPLRFVLPAFSWSRRPAWQMRVGLALYDLLAGRSAMPRHRRLARDHALGLVSALNPSFSSAMTFFDARLESPERLAVELATEAEALGASIHNHARVTAVDYRAGDGYAVTVEDGGVTSGVRARAVVNATGPWSDAVSRLVGSGRPAASKTRGTHIVLDVPGHGMKAAVLSTARRDGRVFFAIPRGDLVLVGTTDEPTSESPEEVRPTPGEIAYLLEEGRLLFPAWEIEASRVVYAYAGLRSLARARAEDPGSISRRHRLVDHGKEGGPPGFFSVVGGKLTTFRGVGQQVLRAMGVAAAAGPPAPAGGEWRSLAWEAGRSASERARLGAYGPRLAHVLALGRRRICEECGLLEGEVVHATRKERARAVADVLARRSCTAWLPGRGLCCLERVAGIMASQLGWDPDRTRREIMAYEGFVARNLPPGSDFG